MKLPRCPEYNAALLKLSEACMNKENFYGFNDKSLSEVQSSVREIIADMLNIFEAKDTDYAANGKPMGNLRSSEELGIPAWKGTLLRMGDKKQRIMSFASRGVFQVKDEQIADTLKDLANYACLASVLFSELYDGEEYSEMMNHFHMLALRAIHCKALAECEMNNDVISWQGKPLEDLVCHFNEIAAFARNN